MVRSSYQPSVEVSDPDPAADVMLPHCANQRVHEVRLVGAPVVLIAAVVVEFLHPYPLPELLLTEGPVENRTAGTFDGLARFRLCF